MQHSSSSPAFLGKKILLLLHVTLGLFVGIRMSDARKWKKFGKKTLVLCGLRVIFVLFNTFSYAFCTLQ